MRLHFPKMVTFIQEQPGNKLYIYFQCIFNDGCGRLGDIPQGMKISVREFEAVFFAEKDIWQIMATQRQAQMATTEYRKRSRLMRPGRDEEQAEREGFPYQAGGH